MAKSKTTTVHQDPIAAVRQGDLAAGVKIPRRPPTDGLAAALLRIDELEANQELLVRSLGELAKRIQAVEEQ